MLLHKWHSFRANDASAVAEANGTTVPVGLDLGSSLRYSRQQEAARGCGRRGVLWEFNRFLPEKPCQTGILGKTTLLIFPCSSSGNHRRHPTSGPIRSSREQFRGRVPIHVAASAARAASFAFLRTGCRTTREEFNRSDSRVPDYLCRCTGDRGKPFLRCAEDEVVVCPCKPRVVRRVQSENLCVRKIRFQPSDDSSLVSVGAA